MVPEDRSPLTCPAPCSVLAPPFSPTAAAPAGRLAHTSIYVGALASLSSSFPLLITRQAGVISLLCLPKPSLARFYVVMAALTPRANSSEISGGTLLILELKSECREHWWVGRRTECPEPPVTADLN